jgi:integrase
LAGAVLHQRDELGRRLPVPRGMVPSFHSFRHTAASEAIAAGESAEEVSWQLGHKTSPITRAVYVQEIKSAERTAACEWRRAMETCSKRQTAVVDSRRRPDRRRKCS